jgi:O-acetyl-ADP-ribose deacetylase (regulator of RNase III)
MTEGNLIDALFLKQCDAIAHCCNCKGVMGSGIALEIKNRIPSAYSAYKEHESLHRLKLGTVSSIVPAYQPDFVYSAEHQVYNMHAQADYGYGKRQVNYEALYHCLGQVKSIMDDRQQKILGVPYNMACDRAGGDWRIVNAMLETIFQPERLLIVKYKQL